MGIGFGLNIRSILALTVLPYSIIFLYSLFNLYIGRETKKYKTIIIALNFILLIGYLFILITIPEYNQVPLIILLLVLLSVIVLGILGGFMYNPEYSQDKSSKFLQQIKWYSRVVKASFITVGLVVVSILVYEVFTHEVDRVVNLTYILENENEDLFCDSHLSFGYHQSAELFYTCDDESINFDNMTKIEIYFDNILIHEDEDELSIYEDNMMYFFNYDIDSILNYETEIEIVKIVITKSDFLEEYSFRIYNERIDYSKITVPIWIRE